MPERICTFGEMLRGRFRQFSKILQNIGEVWRSLEKFGEVWRIVVRSLSCGAAATGLLPGYEVVRKGFQINSTIHQRFLCSL
jgi:hypothetical protein